MRIQHIQLAVALIEQEVRKALPNSIRTALAEYNEIAVVREARRTGGTNAREQVLYYLGHTQRNCTRKEDMEEIRVPNEYLRSRLDIHPHAMKPVREALVAEGLITVALDDRGRGPMEIVFQRPVTI